MGLWCRLTPLPGRSGFCHTARTTQPWAHPAGSRVPCDVLQPPSAVVVVTETDYESSVAVDEACRRAGVAFVRADIRGVFGQIFCDFGDQFVVTDVDGEVRDELHLVIGPSRWLQAGSTQVETPFALCPAAEPSHGHRGWDRERPPHDGLLHRGRAH